MKRLILFFSIILLLFLAAAAFGVFLPKEKDSEKEVFFTVAKGDGLRDIAGNLKEQDLIYCSRLFKAYVVLLGRADKLQAGSYFLSPSMNVAQIAEKMVLGDIAKAKITIPEGFTSEQIRKRLESITDSELLNLEEYEGYLFPDTYYIPYGVTEKEVIRIMTDNFNKKTADFDVTHEVVIMASILEREVITKEEKELAAGLLWKRLENDWFLQVDAHRWTYENKGLPLKPISNPGLESILAALYPKDSEYWFYISKPDGETIFQKTLKEHNIAIDEYLR